MKTSPEVSILMPVYNEELYLKSCIESILSQSFVNWELIIVDDFSTDKSFSVLSQFSKKDYRIKIFRNNQKGIIPALKLAFSHCNGRWVTRMDADDLMPSQKLMSFTQKLKILGPGNIVSGKVKYFSDGILKDGFIKYEKWLNQQLYFENIYQECTLPSACWMAYKSDLDDINAFNQSQYPEDYHLLFKFYEAKYKINGINEVLHLWRDHPLRASRTDPNYADQNFFPLKVQQFAKLDYNPKFELFLWGAGRKGKALAKQLIEHKLPFRWVTENQNKKGKAIYNILLADTITLKEKIDKQIIIAISGRDFQENKSHVIAAIHNKGNQYFHFC